jgi:gliding motility-associated protein GldL|tara:strand:+ start:283 stop:843 length:561 start_codon:yes stop_codon:yes gene_type:complete
MATKKKPFQLSKKVNNAIYGYGAAIVIIGALMKITYFSPDWAPNIANTMLTVGLVIEALIFAYSAIDPSLQKEDYEWERVYPELSDGKAGSGKDIKSPQVLMSEKIDEMFKNAKLDEAVVKELAQSIRDFEASAKSGAKSASDLAKINQEFANNANELTKQMAALSSNLETLNGVYGGVLNAMNRK